MAYLVNKKLLRDITTSVLEPIALGLRLWFGSWIKMHSHQHNAGTGGYLPAKEYDLGLAAGITIAVHLFLEGEMVRYVVIYKFMVCGQCVAWMVRDLKGTWLENWWQGICGRGMWIDLSKWERNEDNFSWEYSPKGYLNRGGWQQGVVTRGSLEANNEERYPHLHPLIPGPWILAIRDSNAH